MSRSAGAIPGEGYYHSLPSPIPNLTRGVNPSSPPTHASTSTSGSNPHPSPPRNVPSDPAGSVSGTSVNEYGYTNGYSTITSNSTAQGIGNGTGNGNARVYDAQVAPDWGEPPRKLSEWEEKVQSDLGGWRGGHGAPRSSVPHAGVPRISYFGQPVTGTIGVDLPKEIVRVERDWSGGEACQFSTTYPLELESRLSPTDFAAFITAINVPLAEAYSTKAAVVDNLIAMVTWWTSLWWRTSHFELELRKAEDIVKEWNEKALNRVGLNALSPRDVALQFLEIEYY